jgi:hypothetical protein
MDFEINGGGSIYLLNPVSESAKVWIEENIGRDNGFQPYWPSVVIEHRYVADVVAGILAEGYTVQS